MHFCRYLPEIVEGAASGGHLHILEHFQQNVTARASHAAALCSQKGVLEWLLSQNLIYWDQAHIGAATGGQLGVLDWIIEKSKGFPVTTYALIPASKEGFEDYAIRLMELYPDSFSAMLFQAANNAAKKGSLKLLKYIYEMDPSILEPFLCISAARKNQLEVLKWFVVEKGIPLPSETLNQAVISDNLDILKFLYAHGCTFNESATATAAIRGNIEILEWLTQNGCSVSGNIAKNASLPALKWLIQKKYEWDFLSIADTALTWNRLDILQYLKTAVSEESWKEFVEVSTSKVILFMGISKNTVQWLIEEAGFPLTPNFVKSLVYAEDIVRWLKAKGHLPKNFQRPPPTTFLFCK